MFLFFQISIVCVLHNKSITSLLSNYLLIEQFCFKFLKYNFTFIRRVITNMIQFFMLKSVLRIDVEFPKPFDSYNRHNNNY